MTDWPSVSVVIPARNAEGTIAETLRAVLGQDYDGHLEVVVADGSDDCRMSRALLRCFPSVRVVPNPARETAAGLNAAIGAARGDVIVRCDAHAVLPSEYVREVVLALERTGAACVGGMQVPVGGTRFGRAVAMSMSSPLGSGDSRYKIGGREGASETVYLGAWRRDTLLQVGGFDETLVRNQDYDLSWRLRQRGDLVWLLPGLRVKYRPRDNVLSLGRQYFDYGWWKAVALGKHPRSLRTRQLAPVTLLTGISASAVFLLLGHVAAGLVLPSVYLAALLTGALVMGCRRREPAAALLPLALSVMHLSWGLGFVLSAGRRGLSAVTTFGVGPGWVRRRR